MQYGVLGIWTATLLWERKNQIEEKHKLQEESTTVLKEVAVNMALVNDNLKQMADTVRMCHALRGN